MIPKNREQQKQVAKKLWEDPEFVKIQVKASHTKPNKAELKLFGLFQKVLPNEYALNVKAEVMILGGKIPDFVNVNGQKKVIELYGQYWHRGDNPEKRINYFKRFGWNTLVVWEEELKEENPLVEKLRKFNRV